MHSNPDYRKHSAHGILNCYFKIYSGNKNLYYKIDNGHTYLNYYYKGMIRERIHLKKKINYVI